MNQNDYDNLLASLNDAVEILYRNRTPNPDFIAAYDTLKQARAMVTSVAQQAVQAECGELAAA